MAESDDERRWWTRQNMWIGLWSPIAVAVFGAGLYAFVEDRYSWAVVFVILGAGATAYIAYCMTHEAAQSNSIGLGITVAVVILVTWGFLGTDLYLYLVGPTRTTESDPALVHELEREKKYSATLEGEKDALNSELNKVRSRSDILENFGADFRLYRRWNPYSEADKGERLPLGRCNGEPCATIQLVDVSGTGPKAMARFYVSIGGSNQFLANLPLRKGCSREMVAVSGGYSLEATIEDDSHYRPQIGIALVPTPPPSPHPGPTGIDLSRWLVGAIVPGHITCGTEVFDCFGPDGGPKDDWACLSAVAP